VFSGGLSGREGGFETDFFPGDGVGEAEVLRVEEIAAVAGESGEIGANAAGGVVEGVAEEGVADGGEVDADLMGTAGVEADGEGGGLGGAGEDRGDGFGGLAGGAGGPDGADERVGDEADGGEDFVVVAGGEADGEGAVNLLNLGGVPVVEQPGGGGGGLGEEDDAGGGAAEAVDGVGGGGAALDLTKEGVFEIAAAGEGREAARFIDGQQMVVLPEDGEVEGRGGLDPGRAVPDEGLAGGEGFGAGGGGAVEGDFAIFEFLPPLGGGGVGIEGGEMGEQGLAVVAATDDGGVGVALIAHLV